MDHPRWKVRWLIGRVLQIPAELILEMPSASEGWFSLGTMCKVRWPLTVGACERELEGPIKRMSSSLVDQMPDGIWRASIRDTCCRVIPWLAWPLSFGFRQQPFKIAIVISVGNSSNINEAPQLKDMWRGTTGTWRRELPYNWCWNTLEVNDPKAANVITDAWKHSVGVLWFYWPRKTRNAVELQ